MLARRLPSTSQAQLTGACMHRDLAINLDEGGMPWTCLPGEPANVNWCNGANGADLYRHPPAAWRGARTQGSGPSNRTAVKVVAVLPRV